MRMLHRKQKIVLFCTNVHKAQIKPRAGLKVPYALYPSCFILTNQHVYQGPEGKHKHLLFVQMW